jgi:hypothetical protein
MVACVPDKEKRLKTMLLVKRTKRTLPEDDEWLPETEFRECDCMF